jgi:hypothetical protein
MPMERMMKHPHVAVAAVAAVLFDRWQQLKPHQRSAHYCELYYYCYVLRYHSFLRLLL